MCLFKTNLDYRTTYFENNVGDLSPADQKAVLELDSTAGILLDHAVDVGRVLIIFEDYLKAEEQGVKFMPGTWKKITAENDDLWVEKNDFHPIPDWKTSALMQRVESARQNSQESKLFIVFFSKEKWCTSYDEVKKVFPGTRTRFHISTPDPGISELEQDLRIGNLSLAKFVQENQPGNSKI